MAKTGCATAKKVGLRWAKNLKSGTAKQRHCAPVSHKTHGTGPETDCKAAGYKCHVTAAPKGSPDRRGEITECRRGGARRVSWLAFVFQ